MKRSGLAESLSKLEVESREILLELLAEFDRRYSDIAEADRGHYTTYFATVSSPELALAQLIQGMSACSDSLKLGGQVVQLLL